MNPGAAARHRNVFVSARRSNVQVCRQMRSTRPAANICQFRVSPWCRKVCRGGFANGPRHWVNPTRLSYRFSVSAPRASRTQTGASVSGFISGDRHTQISAFRPRGNGIDDVRLELGHALGQRHQLVDLRGVLAANTSLGLRHTRIGGPSSSSTFAIEPSRQGADVQGRISGRTPGLVPVVSHRFRLTSPHRADSRPARGEIPAPALIVIQLNGRQSPKSSFRRRDFAACPGA